MRACWALAVVGPSASGPGEKREMGHGRGPQERVLGRHREKERGEGSGPGFGLGRDLGLSWALSSFSISILFLFLIQTKFEFKTKFGFKPHSNKKICTSMNATQFFFKPMIKF